MKTKVAAGILGVGLIVSLCIADSVTPPKQSDELAALRKELRETQSQLQQTIARMDALENQVRALEQSNARLESEVGTFGEPKIIPVQGRPGTPILPEPRLIPLQAK